MLFFVICDPSYNAALEDVLRKILNSLDIEANIALIADRGEEVLNYAKKNASRDNVYLLNTSLNRDICGLDLMKKIREFDHRSYCIFFSPCPKLSVSSFKVKTFDYLVKPINYNDLEKCIKALYEDYLFTAVKNGRITIKSGRELYVLDIPAIIYLEKHGKILTINSRGKRLKCFHTLKEIHKKLAPYGFFRCHKSYLVNLNKIEAVQKNKNLIVMETGDICFVSRKFKKELLQKINNR